MRIGMGYDVHPFKKGRKLIIGGVEIPFELGLDGHSDADVLIHSVIDAILGAANLGTIGEHFPDTDLQYKDIDSRILLRMTSELLYSKGFSIVNIDCIIVAQNPKITPYFSKMREYISCDLGISSEDISIKAKREEGLGFTGNLEGIKAYSVILIEKKGKSEENNEISE